MSQHEEAEKLFVAFEPEEVKVDIEKGPIPGVLREALCWLRDNGVMSCKLPEGEFTFRAPGPKQPRQDPTLDLNEEAAPTAKPDLVVGGFDKNILFAHLNK